MSKRPSSSQQNVGNDMWQTMLDNPIPSPSSFSSSAPQTSNPLPNNMASGSGFASFSGINPFQQPFQQQFQQPFQQPFQQQFFQQQFLQQQLFQQQQQFFNQQQQTQQNPDAEPELDSVASADELVEVTKSPRNKGKKPLVRKNWTTQEAVILSQRWIDASQNPITGRNQSESCFWEGIVKAYNSLVDVPRTKSQLTGKWNKIRSDVVAFGAILKRYTGARHQSGGDDKSVYDAAREHFEAVHKKKFFYEPCYHELKDYPKFWQDHGVMVSRPETPLFHETLASINLDNDDEPVPTPNPTPTPNPAMEALFENDQLRRPPGRNVSRRTASSSDATSSRNSSEETRRQFTQTSKKAEVALSTLEEKAREKAVMDAFRYLQTPIPDGLSKKERKGIERYRKKLWDTYGSEFLRDEDENDSDSDDE